MKYNFKDLRRRVKDIEGGYATLAKRMDLSYQRVMKILDGTSRPKESTMVKLHLKLTELETERDEARKVYAEIFLP